MSGKSRIKTTTTVKSQILTVVGDADRLVGLATIKSELMSRFHREDTAMYRKNVTKALKTLTDENRCDFVKHKGSYYAGADSKVGHMLDQEAETAREVEKRRGWLVCAWCGDWNKEEDLKDFQEAFDARGGSYRCSAEHVSKRFWVSMATQPGETMKSYHKGGYHKFIGNE
jgi:hypothetical protein